MEEKYVELENKSLFYDLDVGNWRIQIVIDKKNIEIEYKFPSFSFIYPETFYKINLKSKKGKQKIGQHFSKIIEVKLIDDENKLKSYYSLIYV